MNALFLGGIFAAKKIRNLVLTAVISAAAIVLLAVPSKAEALTLGDMAVGSSVYLKENGAAKEFIKIANGYGGNTGSLLMRKLSTSDYSDGDAVMGQGYSNSILDAIMTGSYYNRLEAETKNNIIPVQIRCESNSFGSENLVRSCFALSVTELGGGTATYTEGTAIPYFDSNAKRIATNDWGVTTFYATRSRQKNDNNNVYRITGTGTFGTTARNTLTFYRPVFLMSNSIMVDAGNNLVYNTAPTAPSSINATRSGNIINVGWTVSTDTDGNLAGYILERSANGGAWIVVRNANVTSHQDTISEGWTNVQYRVKAYDTPGLESSYTTSAVVAVPYITGIAAGQPTMLHAGGNNTITVSGVNLPSGVSVKVYDGSTEILSGSTSGSATAQTVSVSIPINPSYTQDKPYTIKASWSGGVTWSSFTGAITVERNKTPIITSVTVAPASFNHEGGTIDVYTYGYNLFNNMLAKAEAEDETVTGRTTGNDTLQHVMITIPASWDYANSTTYEVRASLDDGDTWFISPTSVTLSARPVPVPVITQNIALSAAKVEGDPLTLEITAAADVGALTFQWYRDDVPLPGEDENTLNIEPIAISDAGAYYCIVKTTIQGQTATANSNVCNVSVQRQAEVPTITMDLPAEKGIIEWHGLTLTVEAIVPEGTLTYQWHKDGAPLVGETASVLTISEAALEDAGEYFCKITNTYILSQKSIDSATCEVSVEENAPQMITDLSGAKGLIESLELVLTVAATSPDGTLSYAWYKDGTILPGETAFELRIPNVQLEDAGVYYCRVTNSYGTHTRYIDSQTCAVIIEEKPVITQDIPSSMAKVEGDTLQLEIDAAAVTGELSYQWYKDGSTMAGETEKSMYIPSLVLTDAGAYQCRVSLTAHGVTVTVDSGICTVTVQRQAEVPTITTDLPPDKEIIEWHGLTLTVSATVPEGTLTYQWHKDGASLAGETASTLTIEEAEMEDAGTYFCRITNTYILSQKAIDSAVCEISIAENAPELVTDLPRTKTVIEAHELLLYVEAASPDGVLSYAWYKDGVVLPGETTSELHISYARLTDACDYQCRITNTYGVNQRTVDSRTCEVTVQQNAPEIVDDIPFSLSLIETQELKLSVEATSPDGALSYQWFKDGQPLPDATGATLQNSSVSMADAGAYFCRLTNAFGETTWSVDSASCTVSVAQGPAMPVIETDLPETVTVASGSSLMLTASASSLHGDVTYQWYKDGEPITAATASSLYYEVATPSSAGQYYCTITSSVESVAVSISTRVCTVIYEHPEPEPEPEPEPGTTPDNRPSTPVRPPSTPGIISDLPDAIPVKPGETVNLTVEVDERYTSNGAAHYQWYKDGIPVENANGQELVIDVINSTTEGLYQLIITIELDSGEQITIESKICVVYEDLAISDEKLKPSVNGGYDVSRGGVISNNGRDLQVFVVGGKDATVEAIMLDKNTLAVEVVAPDTVLIEKVLVSNETYSVFAGDVKIPLSIPRNGAAVGIFITNIVVNPPKTGAMDGVPAYIGGAAILVSIVSIVFILRRKEL